MRSTTTVTDDGRMVLKLEPGDGFSYECQPCDEATVDSAGKVTLRHKFEGKTWNTVSPELLEAVRNSTR